MNPLLPAAGALAAVALWMFPLDPRWSRPRPARRVGLEIGPVVRRTAVLSVGVLALGVLTGAAWWLLVGTAVAIGVVSARMPVPIPAGRRRAERASLILHADLLAACLNAGMALSAALSAVSGLLDRLDRPEVEIRSVPVRSVKSRPVTVRSTQVRSAGSAGSGGGIGSTADRDDRRDREAHHQFAQRGRADPGRAGRGVTRAGSSGLDRFRVGSNRPGRSRAGAAGRPDGATAGRPDGATARARLRSVAALFELGASPAVAWEPADGHPDLRELAGAARRSAVAGTPVAEAARQQAALLRAARAAEVERSAGRAGVAITAPLGLCFLPAFLCLGLAPVVVGLLGTLGIF